MSSGGTVTGRLPAQLSNAVSTAIVNAIDSGMEPDEAISVALHVLLDYGRINYTDEFIPKLSRLVIEIGASPITGTVTQSQDTTGNQTR